MLTALFYRSEMGVWDETKEWLPSQFSYITQ